MALAYLLDPQLQYSDKSGALNVAGFLRVYLNGTDDRAVTYKDFAGTLNTDDIVLDSNGRAVVIADSTKAYRLEVYTSDGELQWTQYPLNTLVGGAGGASGFVVESTDGTIAVDRYDSGGVIHYDLSATDNLQLEWTRTDSYTIEESAEGTFIVPVSQAEGNMTVDAYGIHLTGGTHYNVSVYVNIDSPSEAVNRFEGIKFRLGGINAPVAEYTVNDSFEHRQTACISCDIHPASDTVFKIHVDGVVNGSELSCNQCTIHSLASYYSGGGSAEYTAGTGINISDNTINVKIDGSTITTNSSGELVANGGSGTVPLSDLSGLRYSQGNTPVNWLNAENGDRPGFYGFMGIKCDPSFVWVEGSKFYTRLYINGPWFGDPSWSYVYPLWYNVADPSKYICATNKNFYALHDDGMIADPVADTTYYVVDIDVYSYDLTWSQPDLITSLDELATSDWAFTYVSYGTTGRFPTGEDGVSWDFARAPMFSNWIPDGKLYAYLQKYGGLSTGLGGLYVDPNYFQKKLTAGTGITIEHTGTGDIISSTGFTPVLVGSAEGYVAASGDTTLNFSIPSGSSERYVYPNKLYMLRCRIGYGSIAEVNTLTFGDNPQLLLCSFDNYNDPSTFSYSGRLFTAVALPKTPTLIDNAHVGERFDAMVDFFDVPTDTVEIEWLGLVGQTGEELRVILKDVTMGSSNHMHLYVDLYRLN